MKIELNEESTDEELSEFRRLAMMAGRFDLTHLEYGARMIRDANAIKNSLSKADRFNLTYHAFMKAITESQRIKDRTGDDGPLQSAINNHTTYLPQYINISIQCLESYHNQRLAILKKSKSGNRQLVSTRVTLKAFSKLDGRYQLEQIKSVYEKIIQYWRDQETLLSVYDQ